MIYIISPILYKTSSFNDIFNWIKKSFESKNVLFKTNEIIISEFKWYWLENPDEYFTHALKTLDFLRENVNSWDTILFLDFFFPWLDLLKYFFERTNKDVKFISLLHWASFVSWDLYSWRWLKNFEKWWLDIFDKVIIPSNFFLENINNKSIDLSKFIIIPWWIDETIEANFDSKIYDVIFPHRFDYDKWVFDFYEIAKNLKNVKIFFPSIDKKRILETFPDDLKDLYFKFKNLDNVILSPLEYWEKQLDSLRKSKIVLSTAKQEWFWYWIIKAIQCWNIPVLPNRCCYPEFFEEKYLYENIDDCCYLIEKFLKNYPKDYFSVKWKFSFDNIVLFIINNFK